MRSENMNFLKCLTIWSRSNYSKTSLWSKSRILWIFSRILWKFTRRVWMGFFLALLVRPVWPVRHTGLTGLAWQSPILPSSQVKQWNLFILPLHRHFHPLLHRALSSHTLKGPPLAIWSSNQGRRVSSWGFGAHHRSDRSPKAVLRFPLKISALKVPNGLFFIDLSI